MQRRVCKSDNSGIGIREGDRYMSDRKSREYYIDFARTVACMLIVNSHFDGVYPINISWGGVPGNCLFFLITGFLLVRSCRNDTNFLRWYIGRLLRIYIPLTICNIITIAVGYRTPSLNLFVFPLQLWFIPSMVVLYVLYYFIIRNWSKYIYLFIGLDIAIYIFCYSSHHDKSVFFVDREISFLMMYGFIAMMIGAIIYDQLEKIDSSRLGCIYFAVALAGVVGFLGIKLLINAGFLLALRLQFLTDIFGMIFATSFFIGVRKQRENIEKYCTRYRFGRLFLLLGQCTLEIYILHYAVVDRFINIIFPVNFLLICFMIIVSGILVHRISDSIYRFIARRIS